MSNILVVTGSLEGTLITGSWGMVQALIDTDITVSSSIPNSDVRFTLPKGEIYTDTGTWLVENSFTEITVWGQGTVIIQSA
jgi:hypothetical protein